MESNNSSKGLKIALGIALALFLGIGFYTMNLYSDSKKVENDLITEKQLVMKDLNAMAKQYDDAIGENAATKKDLVAARERTQGLIDSLKLSENNVKKFMEI